MKTSDLDDTPRENIPGLAKSRGAYRPDEQDMLELPTKVDRIAIIGDGPSRELYDPESGVYDLIIGCNYPHVPVHYSVFVDAYAAKWMRIGAREHYRLKEFRLLMGERCVNNLKNIKAQPASTDSMSERWIADGTIVDVIEYPEEFRGDDQHYFSSGHAAFFWAINKYPDAEIILYGFDSVFTGDHLATHSNVDVREWGEQAYLVRKVRDEPRDCARVWAEMWQTMIYRYAHDNDFISFVGYEGDPPLPFDNTLKDIHAILLPKKD